MSFSTIWELALFPAFGLLILAALGRWVSPRWRYAAAVVIAIRLLVPVAIPISGVGIFERMSFRDWNEMGAFSISDEDREVGGKETSGSDPAEIAAPSSSANVLSADANLNPEFSASNWWPGFWRCFLFLWFIGAFFFLIRLAQAHFRLRQILLNSVPMEKVSEQFGIPILETTQFNQPAVAGLLAPKIFLPHGLSQRLNDSQLKHVIEHERAHVLRLDVASELIIQIALIAYWWNPFLRLLHRRAIHDRELACDAVAGRQDPKAYCKTVADVLRFALQRDNVDEAGTCPALAMASSKSLIENRVHTVLNPQKHSPFATAVLCCLIFGGVAIFGSAKPDGKNNPLTKLVSEAELPEDLVHPRNAELPAVVDRHGIPLALGNAGQRRYPFRALASHVLGYRSASDRHEGIEAYLDSVKEDGANVRLSLDLRIQHITDSALRSVGRGAAVVIEPDTGEILALSSFPDFDPNAFFPKISKENYEALVLNPAMPMFPRVVRGTYSPGSSVVPVIALAMAKSGHLHSKFECGGGKLYGRKFIKCWSPDSHGEMGIREGISQSCNGYFYRASNATGIEEIKAAADLLGFGREPGIPLQRCGSGHIPDPELLTNHSLAWSDAFTALVSIGQGATETTPLEMASMMSTIANGGSVMTPELIYSETKKPPSAILKEHGITDEELQLIRLALRDVVQSEKGTAKRANLPGIDFAGKTGTAQTADPRSPSNAWFVGFAPFENPRFAIAVFVENARSGGGVAAPIAAHIVQKAMNLKAINPKTILEDFPPLEPAPGHLDRVDSVEPDSFE